MDESIISLIGSTVVALGALCGVFVNNWWADERRKKDQQAEDDRRRAEEEQREKERREQFQREDSARQRRAVVQCHANIYEASRTEQARHDEFLAKNPNIDEDKKLWAKAIGLNGFYQRAKIAIEDCEIEVSEPKVLDSLHNLWVVVDDAERFLDSNGEAKDYPHVSPIFDGIETRSPDLLEALQAVRDSARHAFAATLPPED